ncbi:MAG: FmdE family protein [Desulfobaccales bacterium]
MHEHASPRQAIETMIRCNDLPGLLRHAESIHGHLCPYLALGVKAGRHAMAFLDQENTGMEEVVAIVECNNCFTDGIQVVTGCTFGNNSLIYQDLGKTAVTVARRVDGAAVRLVVHPDFREHMFSRYPAAGPLFEKVVVQRQGTAEDLHRFHHLWEGVARRELEEVPLEEQFLIETLTIRLPAYARILATEICARCGEGVMESRIRVQGGQKVCLACAGEEYFQLTGQGIGCSREV